MKRLLLIFSLFILCAVNIFAQKKTCDLKLEVIQNQANSSVEKVRIEDAEAVTYVLRDNVKNKAKLADGMPYFADLKEGNYTVAVKKKDYKTTIKRIHLDCSAVKDKTFVAQEVWMWSGNPKEKIHFIDSDYNAEVFKKMWVVDLALELPLPEYPKAARAIRASGTVAVEVTIDEKGDVISAERASGHPLLALSAVNIAKKAKFVPSVSKGEPVKITGFIIYNFVP
jgi:TonB family protein